MKNRKLVRVDFSRFNEYIPETGWTIIDFKPAIISIDCGGSPRFETRESECAFILLERVDQ